MVPAGHVVYAHHVADHEILVVAEVASAPALVNCRVSSPSRLIIANCKVN